MKFVVEDAAEIIIKAEVTKVVDECNTDDDEVFRPWFGPDPLLTASEVALEWLIEIKDRKLKSYEAQLNHFSKLLWTHLYFPICDYLYHSTIIIIYNYKMLICKYGNVCHRTHKWNSKRGNPDRGISLYKPHMLYRVTIC